MEINAKCFSANAGAIEVLGGELLRRVEIASWRPMARTVAMVITIERAVAVPEAIESIGKIESRVAMRWLASFVGFDADNELLAASERAEVMPSLISILAATLVADNKSRSLGEWQRQVQKAMPPRPKVLGVLGAIAHHIWAATLELPEPRGCPSFRDIGDRISQIALEMGEGLPLMVVNGFSDLARQAEPRPIEQKN